jgi:hypothetical protein
VTRVLLAIALALPAVAAPISCIPNTLTDSQSVDQSCYGGTMHAIPGAEYNIWTNDNGPLSLGNDWDGNDAFMSALVSEDGTSATFVLLGGMSAHLNQMYVGDTLLFDNRQPVGTTAHVQLLVNALVPLWLRDTVTGGEYAAIADNLNWIIARVDTPSQVLEPSGEALMVLGAGMIGLWACWKRIRA